MSEDGSVRKVVAYNAPTCVRCGTPGTPFGPADKEPGDGRVALKCIIDGVVWDTGFEVREVG